MAKATTARPKAGPAKVKGAPPNTKGAFVGFRGQEEIDFGQFPKVAGDVKGKATFDALTAGLDGKLPVRLRIGQSSKALALKPGTVGISANVSEVAKAISVAVFRKDPLAWVNYAVGRQRPLAVGDEADRFLVLPRVDARFSDDPLGQPHQPSSPAQLDGLGGAILILADRLTRMPGLANDVSRVHASLEALRGDIQTLAGEFKLLAGELKGVTVEMHTFADRVGSLNDDVKLAVGVSGR